MNGSLKVAVVGSGPSGFYVAEAFANSGINVEVTVLERLPCPFGLVRYGVAPDHQKLKSVTGTLEAIADHPAIEFLGNVHVDKDITLQELRELYHIVVLTTGMPQGASLGLPGENLLGVHPASNFIGWYNGHPDFQHLEFDLSQETAIIIGQGNVAIDICRILSKSISELKSSDITAKALDALSQSRIREIHMIGRRGPVQAKFTTKELHELGKLENCKVTISPEYMLLNEASVAELEDPNNLLARKNFPLYTAYSENSLLAVDAQKKHISIDFMMNPKCFDGDTRLTGVVFEESKLIGEPFKQKAIPTGKDILINCGLAFTSVGFKGREINGAALCEVKGTILNEHSRVLDSETRQPIHGLYVAGWVKRGPQGVIGTNRECAADTFNYIMEDIATLTSRSAPGVAALRSLLQERNVKSVSFEEWRIIDNVEKERGKALGKPREKFTSVEDMLNCL